MSVARFNRLGTQTSPYLLSHAENPVHWQPWDAKALTAAKEEDKPILLSIGYSACHWCHVMERESFEDSAIARLMNEHFINIKVDREERPDLDEIYMAATVALSGSGGWPMTVFLTPDQKPFFAGTYFPPEDRYGRPGFPTLLRRVAQLWSEERQQLDEQAAELTAHVKMRSRIEPRASLHQEVVARAVDQLKLAFDQDFGGFGSAPKFPPSQALRMLLRFSQSETDEQALHMAEKTLFAMKNGGLYDHLGGGFCRYSTDERWLVPHFEKMLYDNAQLARVYLEAYQVTKKEEYRRIARETLDYVIREMQAPEGGYFSATDADSEGEEGKYFVWSKAEVVDVVGAEAARTFCSYFDVSEEGNWEGRNILNTPRPAEEVAKELGLEMPAFWESLSLSREALYERRLARVPPLLDDKILTSWNGLMIDAMAEGYRVLGDPRYLISATRAKDALLKLMRRPDGGLFRTARGERAHLDAYLEDYAFLADGLLSLYEAGGEAELLAQARNLAERLIADFDAEDGAFYFTARDHEPLISRPREGQDGAIPNPNAVAARALMRLGRQLDEPRYVERAALALRAYGGLIEKSPRAFPSSLVLLSELLEPPVEVVFAGHSDSEELRELVEEVARHWLSNRVIAHVDAGQGSRAEFSSRPLTRDKGPVEGQAAVFVCRGGHCERPVTSPQALATVLAEGKKSVAQDRSSHLQAQAIPGAATKEGTARYVASFGNSYDSSGFALLDNLLVSRIGFGGYRIASLPEHESALEKALLTGCNVIDTSTNYTNGESERLIGGVLRKLKSRTSRDQIVVISKIGYVQGENLEIAQRRERQGTAFAEMNKLSSSLWHCIHPDWLSDQLSRSLARLGLETLDVCLLHNPEYFFKTLEVSGRSLSELRNEFYSRLEAAFAALEREVKAGRIRRYGVSSNTVASSSETSDATDLSRMLDAAEKAGGSSHRFRVLQLPLNPIENWAILKSENDGTALVELAQKRGVSVLTNRPLNAIADEGLRRLADVPDLPAAPGFELALKRLEKLEIEFRTQYAHRLSTGDGGPPAETLLSWAESLTKLPTQAKTFVGFRELEQAAILPRANQVLGALDKALGNDPTWEGFRRRYAEALNEVLAALLGESAEASRRQAKEWHDLLNGHLPKEKHGESLSRKILWLLRSLPAVTSVLVGMRKPAYVDDALGVLSFPALVEAPQILAALKS